MLMTSLFANELEPSELKKDMWCELKNQKTQNEKDKFQETIDTFPWHDIEPIRNLEQMLKDNRSVRPFMISV